MQFIDYSTFPLDVLQKALADLRRMKAEGFPVDMETLSNIQLEIIERKVKNL